jgi:hypothetical protein
MHTSGIVIANHLEAISHGPVQRTQLREAADRAGINDKLKMPDGGATIIILGPNY